MLTLLLQAIIGWNKDMRKYQLVSVSFRLSLGMLLLVNGFGEIRGRTNTNEKIKSYFQVTQADEAPVQRHTAAKGPSASTQYLLPEPLLDTYFSILPYLETALGILLVLGLFTRPVAAGATLLFISFIYGMSIAGKVEMLPGFFIYIGAAMTVYICSLGDLWSLDGVFFRAAWRSTQHAVAMKKARKKPVLATTEKPKPEPKPELEPEENDGKPSEVIPEPSSKTEDNKVTQPKASPEAVDSKASESTPGTTNNDAANDDWGDGDSKKADPS